MVVWDYGVKSPRTSALVQSFDNKELAEQKVLADATVETDRLNKEWHKENPGHIGNPFVLDECSDCSAIIRFWDGDDYQCVEMYNVYEIVDKGDNWCYREYRICAKGGSFRIEKNNVLVSSAESWAKALDIIDGLEINDAIKNV